VEDYPAVVAEVAKLKVGLTERAVDGGLLLPRVVNLKPRW
jgi:hypothetical protein